MFDALLHDLRYAVRHLRRSPGFSFVVIATLALGIGANTALFSLLNAIVLRPLSLNDPGRLVSVSLKDSRGQQFRFILFSTFNELKRRQQVFERLAAYSSGGIFRTEANGASGEGVIEGVTPDFYDVLGVRPYLGRVLSDADAPAVGEAAPVVVVGYRFWRRQLGGDPRVVGQTLKVENVPLTIVGVMNQDFEGLRIDAGIDITVPLGLLRRLDDPDPRRVMRSQNIIARLRRGVTLQQAQAALATLWPSIQTATMPAGLSGREQEDLRNAQVRVDSIAGGFSGLRDRYAPTLSLLAGVTALLLFIACVNLSGLLMARAAARDQQMAVCLALGATRARLVQQLVVESVALSVMGTAVAVPLAWWTSSVVGAELWGGANAPLALSVTPDVRVLALTALAAIATGLAIGVLPAWTATRRRTQVGLQPARGTTGATGRSGRALLVAQIALSLVLLFGAALFTRSLARLRGVDSGFRAGGLVSGRAFAQIGGYRNIDEPSYYPELARQLSALPGVKSVALSRLFPAYFSFPPPTQPIARAEAVDHSNEIDGLMEVVSPRFFETVGARLVEGRDLTWQDDAASTPVAVVTMSVRRRLFPDGDAVGRRIRIGVEPKRRSIEIVGVVNDITIGNLRAPHALGVFRPALQETMKAPMVTVRVSGDPDAIAEPLRRTIFSLGHEYLRSANTLDDLMNRSMLQERLMATLSSFFAALAILLAFIGLYGLLAYAVARRTREIGVRMAIGASWSTVVRIIVREGVTLASIGVAIGVPCALAAGRLTGALLFGLSASDPFALSLSAVFFVLVGLTAGLLPAYRAATVDPMIALRCE